MTTTNKHCNKSISGWNNIVYTNTFSYLPLVCNLLLIRPGHAQDWIFDRVQPVTLTGHWLGFHCHFSKSRILLLNIGCSAKFGLLGELEYVKNVDLWVNQFVPAPAAHGPPGLCSCSLLRILFSYNWFVFSFRYLYSNSACVPGGVGVNIAYAFSETIPFRISSKFDRTRLARSCSVACTLMLVSVCSCHILYAQL